METALFPTEYTVTIKHPFTLISSHSPLLSPNSTTLLQARCNLDWPVNYQFAHLLDVGGNPNPQRKSVWTYKDHATISLGPEVRIKYRVLEL